MAENDLNTVYLARHGQTTWNLVGRRQGRQDSPLTEAGCDQARRLAARMATFPIDGLFSSPLGRATETAAVCGRRLGLQVTIIEELAETDHGRMAGLSPSDIEQAFPGEFERRSKHKYEWKFPDGESYSDVDRRAAVALNRLSMKSTRTPLIVSHEMIGRMLLRHLLQLDPEVLLGWRHPHDVVYEIDVAARIVHEISIM
jgi:broad specificity phosphatase PhoE